MRPITRRPITRIRARAGMTLLEMLFAVTLFAAISTSVGLLLRTGFETMNRVNTRIDRTRRFLGAQRALDQMVNGIVPVVAPCGGSLIAFSGSPNAMRFVSSYSLTEGSRGRLMFVEIFWAEHPDKDGFRLLVNERPYLGKASLEFYCRTAVGQGADSFILADRVKSAPFSYRRINEGSGAESWLPVWQFADWPTGIRIDIASRRAEPGQFQFQPLVLPITVRNVNQDVNGPL